MNEPSNMSVGAGSKKPTSSTGTRKRSPGENGRHRGRGAAVSTGSAGAPDSMASSVTRHAQMTELRDWKYLTCGVDSLDLGLYVNWHEWMMLMPRLNSLREEAQNDNNVFWGETCAGPCLVLPKGKPPMYRYHLQVPDIHVYLQAQEKHKDSPNVYVSIGSKLLWIAGVHGAVEVVRVLIEELDGWIDRIQPSRCGLAADFLVPGGIPLAVVDRYRVSRSKKTNQYLDGDRLETYYIGKKASPVQARIYDKGKEVSRPGGKTWFTSIWELDSPEDVWRIEYQLRRLFLKERGIDTVEDLVVNLGSMWAYLTEQWFSLRLDDDSNVGRRTVHPFWEAVQSCGPLLGEVGPLDRVAKDVCLPSVEWYLSHCGGCLEGYAAHHGEGDLQEAVVKFGTDLFNHLKARGDFAQRVQAKAIRIGRQLNSNGEGGGDGIPF